MFPIMDVSSHVIGFGGRVMGDGKPKYLNSPETKIFDKSRNLFGLNYAKQGRRKNLILCEGYMDVIAMHQAGFTGAVASLGTAFTEQQASLLHRYTQEVLLIYDSDEAGVKAALRAIPILRRAGISGKVVHLEPYKDPDEFIQNEGSEAFEERLEQAENSFFFEVEALKRQFDFSDPEQKTKFYHEVARKLLVFTDKVQRDNYMEAVAARQGIRKEDLRQLVIRYGNQVPEGYQEESREPRRERKREDKSGEGINYSYQLLLSWLIETPDLFPSVRELVTPEDFLDERFGKVAAMLYEQLDQFGELERMGRLEQSQRDQVAAKITGCFQDLESQNMVAQMFQTHYQTEMNREKREKALNELIVRIKEYSIDSRLRSLKDASEFETLIQEKKKWQNPEKLHISLKDG